MSKETILIHSSYVLAGGPNGVDNFIGGIVPQLKKDGYSVRRSGPSKKEVENMADFTLGWAVKVPGNKTQAEVGLTLPFTSQRAEKILLTIKPDIVVMHEPLAGNSAHTLMRAMPKREDGTPFSTTIGHFHSMAETLDFKTRLGLFVAKYSRTPQLGKKYRLPTDLTPGVMHTVMGELDGRIAVSNATGRRWDIIYPGEYAVIPNGIDVTRFTPEGAKIEKWIEEVCDGSGNVIGSLIMMGGRHDSRKRLDIGIRAFAEIRKVYPHAKLKITGFGKETDKLKKLVNELGLDIEESVLGGNRSSFPVEFVGVLTEDNLAKAYRTADVFMALSESGEGWGRVGVEALASGAYLVETSIDGHLEAVGGLPYVWMVQPSNVFDTVRGLMETLKASEEKTIAKTRIMHDAVDSNYSWGKIARRTEVYYEQCMRKRGKVSRSEWPKKERKNGFPKKGVIFGRRT